MEVTAKPRRKAMSKTLRFEVFKRDLFTCQYCGAHPPEAVLQVDHIVAVANGGTNKQDNLVTSCQPCNIGKGVRDLMVAPTSLADKAKLVAEREAQLIGYHEILQSKLDREEDQMWRVADIVSPRSSEIGIPRDQCLSIKRFIEKIGLFETIGLAEVARAKFPGGGRRALLYFFGCCWNFIRSNKAEDNA
jgi:HNH endonuclease